jgi:hypothetical protein
MEFIAYEPEEASGTNAGSDKLPGLGLPLSFMPEEHFPTAVPHWQTGWAGTPVTVRERAMETIMNLITDKPDWHRKVLDDSIISKWRQEALSRQDLDVSENSFQYVSERQCRPWHGSTYAACFCSH